MDQKPYLNVEEVARRFDVTESTIYRLAQQGKLPCFKVGGQWRFSRRLLESWVADQAFLELSKAEGGKPPSRKRLGRKAA